MPKKIEKKELEELRRRHALVNQHLITADALNNHVKGYTRKLLEEKGYDMEKNYNIDLNKGRVIEQKEDIKK